MDHADIDHTGLTGVGGGGGGALGNIGIAQRTAGDLTTSSSTFVDVTDMAVTITTGATRSMVIFTANGQMTTTGQLLLDLAIDGTRVGGALGTSFQQLVNVNDDCGFTYITDVLTAGSHTFKIQWRVTEYGTAMLYASTSVTPLRLQVVDLGV